MQATLARALADAAAARPRAMQRRGRAQPAARRAAGAARAAAGAGRGLPAGPAGRIRPGHRRRPRLRASSFESLPLLGDEQLQDNMDLVRAAQRLQQAVQPQLAELEALLAAAQLRRRTAASSAIRCGPRSTCAPCTAWCARARCRPRVRRRWLRYLPPPMAPELAAGLSRLGAARLRAQGLVPAARGRARSRAAPQEGGDRAHPAHHPRAAQAAGRRPGHRQRRRAPAPVERATPSSRRPCRPPSRCCRTCARSTRCCSSCASARRRCRTAPAGQPRDLREALRQQAQQPVAGAGPGGGAPDGGEPGQRPAAAAAGAGGHARPRAGAAAPGAGRPALLQRPRASRRASCWSR